MTQALGVRAEVCYPGVPTSETLGEVTVGEYLLAVSPLRPKKNIHNIIEALHVLVVDRGREDIHLKIVGEGKYQAELEALAQDRNVISHVEFSGRLTDRELAETFREARLSVYIPIDEPFGLIAVESMYHGTPPIVSDHGGVTESVIHNETGLLANPFDPEKVADAILSLWDDDERIYQMGLAGRKRVEQRFTHRRFLDRVESFLT
jgi:glycosyltransferase involved in cell wall biosynthesis